ncbi:MAG: hypothetical protein GW892_09005 [Armatimonadetes bacterium]|nr:hypothetical protein [Armatimonadota bacterium]
MFRLRTSRVSSKVLGYFSRIAVKPPPPPMAPPPMAPPPPPMPPPPMPGTPPSVAAESAPLLLPFSMKNRA